MNEEASPPPAEPSPAPAHTHAKTLRKASRWEIYLPSGAAEDSDAVFVASFPKIIYFWPSVLMLLVCGILQKFEMVAPAKLVWWAIGILAANFMIIVQDFDQKKFIILSLMTLAIGLLAWIIHLKQLTFLDGVVGWLKGLDMSISADVYLVMGSLMFIFTVWGLFRPMFDYWRLEPNEFVHYIQPFGRDMSVPRIGHTVNKEIPDVLEYLLTMGGGSLVIRSGDRVVARIPDIPMLGRRMRRIEQMLGVTRVTHVGR